MLIDGQNVETRREIVRRAITGKVVGTKWCLLRPKITDRTPASENIFAPKKLTHETRNFAATAHFTIGTPSYFHCDNSYVLICRPS
jgi:hypothetical protein